MSTTSPHQVYRAAILAAVRKEIDSSTDERWEALASAYRGVSRTDEESRRDRP